MVVARSSSGGVAMSISGFRDDIVFAYNDLNRRLEKAHSRSHLTVGRSLLSTTEFVWHANYAKHTYMHRFWLSLSSIIDRLFFL